jgi:hypothetical protein
MEIIRTEEDRKKEEETIKALWGGSTKKQEEEFQKWMEEMEKEIAEETQNSQADTTQTEKKMI